MYTLIFPTFSKSCFKRTVGWYVTNTTKKYTYEYWIFWFNWYSNLKKNRLMIIYTWIQRYIYKGTCIYAFINLVFFYSIFISSFVYPPPFLVTKTMEIAGEVHFFPQMIHFSWLTRDNRYIQGQAPMSTVSQ